MHPHALTVSCPFLAERKTQSIHYLYGQCRVVMPKYTIICTCSMPRDISRQLNVVKFSRLCHMSAIRFVIQVWCVSLPSTEGILSRHDRISQHYIVCIVRFFCLPIPHPGGPAWWLAMPFYLVYSYIYSIYGGL